MKIALIGNGITNLILANILSKKNISTSLFYVKKKINSQNSRTIGISKYNIDFFEKNKLDLRKISWPINKIKVFHERDKKNAIFEFNRDKSYLFSIIKNNDLNDILEKSFKKNKLISKFKIKNNFDYEKIIKNDNFDLIINTDNRNIISKKFFFKKINKDYNSQAYTTFIRHQSCKNNTAYQIFTSKGPLAFLPFSKNKTSIVYSLANSSEERNDIEIKNLINHYNSFYKIFSFEKFENFKLNFSVSRNYYFKNILCFGENLHKIHPLAGQGFNMTLRDIKILEELIDFRLNLGLPLDKSILKEFENKTKATNYLFSSGIDFIHDFFKFDNRFGNNYTKNILKSLGNRNLFNESMSNIADKGLYF